MFFENISIRRCHLFIGVFFFILYWNSVASEDKLQWHRQQFKPMGSMDLSQRLPRRNIHIQQPPDPIKLRPRNVLSLRYSDGRAAKIKPCHGGLDARIIDGTVLESWKSSFPPSAPPPPWQSLGRPRCWCQWGSARPRASSSTPASRSSGCRPLPAAGSTTVVDWLPRKSIDLPRKLLLDFLTGEEYVRHHTCHYQIIYAGNWKQKRKHKSLNANRAPLDWTGKACFAFDHLLSAYVTLTVTRNILRSWQLSLRQIGFQEWPTR